MRSLKVISLLVPLAACGVYFLLRPPAPPGSHEKPVQITGRTMGGTWSVKVARLPAGQSEESVRARIQTLLDGLESRLSDYRDDSDLSRFNRHRGSDWLGVSPELAEVVSVSRRIAEETGGVFDPTVAPLVQAWGFGPGATTRPRGIPATSSLAASRQVVGYPLVESRPAPPALRKLHADVKLDLGAIGKGYAADAVSQLLDRLGAPDYLIAVGGELRAKGGSKSGQSGWRVGIESPSPDTHRVLVTLDLRDQSLSTSGGYRNFIEADGRSLPHLIDPRTGRPADSPLASVSVLDASGARADALATALFVMGPDEGLAFADREGLAALFVLRDVGGFVQRASRAWPK